MDIVFATCTGVAGWNGRGVALAEGDPWWADDPFVKAHPDLFAERPRMVFGHTGVDVNSATTTPARAAKRRARRS